MSGALPVHDARRIPDGAELDYDVCIVGTGAAGATAVLGLVGRGLRIAVIEGGGLAPDAATDELLALECSRDVVAHDSRERWLGGTTNAWTGGKTTLDDIDLQARAWVPGSGWPISPTRLRDAYRRAAALLDWPAPEWYDPPLASSADGVRLDNDDLRAVTFHESKAPMRFGELLRSRLDASDGVDLFVLANATEVRLDEDGARVAGVDLATLVGTRFGIRAPVVVVACGAIENARLLLASHRRRPAGLGNGHDHVGRYFQDHPKGHTGLIAVRPDARLPSSSYWAARPTRDGARRLGVAMTARAQEHAEVLNTYARLEAVVLETVPPGIAAARRAVRGRVRGLDPAQLASLLSERGDLARLARFRLRNEGPIDAIRLRSFLEQEPRPDNRVRLGERLDRFGRPVAAVDWSLSDLDRRSVRVLHDLIDAEVRRLRIGSLHADLDDDAATWSDLADASHHAGTTRMGSDPRLSVTDPGGAVHEVGGLFVAGPSLFPTSGYANPVFTIAAISLLVADHVLEHLDPPPATVTVPATTSRPTAAGRDEARRWVSDRRRTRRARPAGSRALAVVWTSPGRAELVPTEVRRPGPGQVSVLVEASAVSPGTERARWLRQPGAQITFPHRPGYSVSGIVERCGPGVYDIEPGARVAVWSAPHQSLVTVPRDQVHDVTAAVAGRDPAEPAVVTLGAIAALGLARAGSLAGRSVAVLGAGPIGLLAARLAVAGGASECTVVATSRAKGAAVTAGPRTRLRAPAGIDAIGADVVIEASGAADAVALSMRAARSGGTVVLLGTTRAATVPVPLDLVSTNGLRVVGAHGGLLDRPGGIDGVDRRSAAEVFLRAWADGAVDTADLITHRSDPRDVADLYERLADDRTQLVPVIEWWRLPDGLRAQDGPIGLPNPLRTGFRSGWLPRQRVSAVAVPGLPAAPPAPDRAADGGHVRAESVTSILDRNGLDGPVRVVGDGPAAAELAARLGCRSTSAGGPPAVVDTAPTVESVTDALGSLAPSGALVVAGPAGTVDIDVQRLIHRRGTVLLGVPTEPPTGQDGPTGEAAQEVGV